MIDWVKIKDHYVRKSCVECFYWISDKNAKNYPESLIIHIKDKDELLVIPGPKTLLGMFAKRMGIE